jgi:hypothetical protein
MTRFLAPYIAYLQLLHNLTSKPPIVHPADLSQPRQCHLLT